ncbi:MAG: ABC transporter substrate-binding protein [Okeania sp. SIO3B5]|uniref:ABC transporter substrate-binding protein n=1 Tax=Okeania sp. SIO3B5 TaxID=2607811 RepID=UPI00140013F2|nr:ABC transporter substrate-binding protein [Okeania sp. SIO3B5]NEO53472.1 ABC transporter substrate-binding protein [Okeania sp. SIO3B5]
MKSAKNWENPYIIGRSIYEPELFFGRENIFRFIEDNLNNNQQVILLHGQRRIGKSSVLQQIPKQVNLDNKKFVFILSDFQHKGQWSLDQIIYKLAQEIYEHLGITTNAIGLPPLQDLKQDTAAKFRVLLHQILQKLGSRNLVLLLDEFDVLSGNNNDSGLEGFFGYLKLIMSQEKQLFIIPVLGRRLSDIPKLIALFKDAPNLRIGLLDESSTKNLITIPPRKFLEYNDRAIDEIIRLSTRHPYFTQVICYALFVQARENEKTKILLDDVGKVINNAIELSEAGLAWFREGLLIPERVVFSAAAEAQNRRLRPSPLEDPLNLLKRYGVITQQLGKAQQTLIENEFLDRDGRKVIVEFVRRWLIKYCPLQSEISELGKLNAEANDYYEKANIWRERGNVDDELYHYRKALELNPNHFSALFGLAEACQKNEKFPEARELYKRGYKIDRQRVKKDYIEPLLSKADNYLQSNRLPRRNLSLVKKLYEQVLEIDRNNTKARNKLKELKDKENIKIPIRFVISAAVLAFPILIGIGIFLGTIVPDFQLWPIFSSEEKRQRFSSGENTVFYNTNNENYNRDIFSCNQEFQKQNYNEAANCFDGLAQDYRNEPELLIYYNNSLARNHNNPIKIAVVVPANKNSERAKSILRGVAQAQNEYNKNQNNIRLLEIIIANDSNDNEVSPKVAQEIVRNPDILGVIGHNSSNATKAALEVYEKRELAVISATSTSTELKGDAFLRTVIDNSVMTKKLVEYVQLLPTEKIVVFYNEQSSYSKSLKDFFDFDLNNMNPNIQVGSIDLKQPSFDINKEIQDATNNQFKIGMLFPNVDTVDSVIEIAKANYELSENQKLRLFGSDILYNCDTLKKGQQAVKGLILAVPWFKGLPTAKPFLDRAKAQWGGEVGWRTATSYDATKAFIDALSNSGDNPTRSRVLEKLKEVNLPYNETSGQNLRFNPEGEITGQAILVEVVESPNRFCSNLDFRLVDE